MTRTTTILWIHGWGTSPGVWGHDGTIVHIDHELPRYGHAYIDYSGCESSAEFKAIVRDQLLHHEADEYILIGWSFGAMLALEAVMAAEGDIVALDPNSKHRIASVIIVSGTLRFTDTDRTLGWPQKIVARMRSKLAVNRQEVLQQFSRSMISPDEQELDWTSLIHQLDTDFSTEGLEAGLTYLLDTDLRARWDAYASSINSPSVLWIHGMNDMICPVGAMPTMITIASLTEEKLEAAGHLPFLSHSKLFYEHLRRFLP